MSERRPLPHVQEMLELDPKIGRLAKFLVHILAFQLGDRIDVDVPIEGTDKTYSVIPEKDEIREWEKQVRDNLTQLCRGDTELALDVRDYYLFAFFDERNLWPDNENN